MYCCHKIFAQSNSVDTWFLVLQCLHMAFRFYKVHIWFIVACIVAIRFIVGLIVASKFSGVSIVVTKFIFVSRIKPHVFLLSQGCQMAFCFYMAALRIFVSKVSNKNFCF